MVLIDANTAQVNRDFADADAGITSATEDTHGGWYVAGGFTHIGKAERPGLSRLRRDGSVDNSFNPDLPKGIVRSVVTSGESVIVSTDSTVVALEAHTGKRMWTMALAASSLAIGNDVLYVSGPFKKVGRVNREAVAAISISTGKLTAWNISGWGNIPPEVNSVTVADGVVYIGGSFAHIGTVSDPCDIAGVDSKNGRTIWVPKVAPTCSVGINVERVLVSHDEILVGSYHGGFLSFDIRTSEIARWSKRIHGSAYPFAVSGRTIYLGGVNGTLSGNFRGVGKQAVNNLAAIVLPNGRLKHWHPKLGKCVDVNDIAVSGHKVLVVGRFSKSSCD